MKKQITWLDNILKKCKFFFILLIFLNLPNSIYASERWVLDKALSTIEFELPVLFAKNVKGSFNTIEGFVELDVRQKENNKSRIDFNFRAELSYFNNLTYKPGKHFFCVF